MKQTQTKDNTGKKTRLIFGLGALVFIGAIAWGASMNISYCMKKGGDGNHIVPPNRPSWATAVTPKFDVLLEKVVHTDESQQLSDDEVTYDLKFTFSKAPGNNGQWKMPTLEQWKLDNTSILETNGKTSERVEGKLQSVLNNNDNTAFSNWVMGGIFDTTSPIGKFLADYGSAVGATLDQNAHTITYAYGRDATDPLITSIDDAGGGIWLEVGLDLAKLENGRYQFNSTYNIASALTFDIAIGDGDDDSSDNKSIGGSLLGALLGPIGTLIAKTGSVGADEPDYEPKVRIEVNPGTYQLSAHDFTYNFDLLSLYNTNPSIRYFESKLDNGKSGSVSLGESTLLKFGITGDDNGDDEVWYNPFTTDYDTEPMVKYGSVNGLSNFGEPDFLGIKYLGEMFYFEPILSDISNAGVSIFISDEDGTFPANPDPDYTISGGSGLYFGDQENHKSVSYIDTMLGLYVNEEVSILTTLVSSGVIINGFKGDGSGKTSLATAYDQVTDVAGNTADPTGVTWNADKIYRDYLESVNGTGANPKGITTEGVEKFAHDLAHKTSGTSEMADTSEWLAEAKEWRTEMVKLATDRDNRYSSTQAHIVQHAGGDKTGETYNLDGSFKTRFIAANPNLVLGPTGSSGTITDNRANSTEDYTSLIKFAPKNIGWPQNKVSQGNVLDYSSTEYDGNDNGQHEEKGSSDLSAKPSNVSTCAATIKDNVYSSPATKATNNYEININDLIYGDGTMEQYGLGNSSNQLKTNGQIGAFAAPILKIDSESLDATINFPFMASINSLTVRTYSMWTNSGSGDGYTDKDNPFYAYSSVDGSPTKWKVNPKHYANNCSTYADLSLLSNYGVSLDDYVPVSGSGSDQLAFQNKHTIKIGDKRKEKAITYTWQYDATDFWDPISN